MHPRPIEHIAQIRVRYADTDQMGIVYYGKYFEYFEVARTEMLRAIGLPYRAIEENGFQLPVVDASAKYFRGARYDDLLLVKASMKPANSPKLEIEYKIVLDITGDVIATGATTLVFIDARSGKPSRPPAMYREVIKQYLAETVLE